MIRRVMVLMVWLMIAALAIAGSILAWPHIQETYVGAVLSGRCDDYPKPDACRKRGPSSAPHFSVR
jgi:hypothetical protein